MNIVLGKENMYSKIRKLIEAELDTQLRLKNRYSNELKKLNKYRNYYLCGRNRNGTMYYYKVQRRTHKEKYIGSTENSEVRALQKSDFYRKSIRIIDKNVKAAKAFIKMYKDSQPQSVIEELARCNQNVTNVLRSNLSPSGEQWRARMEAIKSRHEVYRPEDLIHVALDGSLYRSKSELAIANYLITHNIPFVYELPVETKNGLIIPDFTIYNEKTGEIIFWEHMGMLYEESYYQKQYHKFIKYSSIGYTPFSNLIVTVDDINGSFDSTVIPRLLHAFMPEVA